MYEQGAASGFDELKRELLTWRDLSVDQNVFNRCNRSSGRGAAVYVAPAGLYVDNRTDDDTDDDTWRGRNRMYDLGARTAKYNVR